MKSVSYAVAPTISSITFIQTPTAEYVLIYLFTGLTSLSGYSIAHSVSHCNWQIGKIYDWIFVQKREITMNC